MEANHVQGASKDSYHGESEIELIGDESERVGRRSSKLNFSESTSSAIDLSHDEEDKDYVEITPVKLKPVTANNDHSENDKLGLLGKKGMGNKSYFGDSLSIGMNRIKQVSQELKRFASFSTQGGPLKGYDRTNSAASHALKGFEFISNSTTGSAWAMVKKNFEELTKETNDGLLRRSRFAECLGMNKESAAFGEELFDVLSRRRNFHGDSINKAQLRKFFDDISDPDFDSRLRIFFDMVDKDANGSIDEKEIKQIIQLSATANNLSIIHDHAEEYAALIMEELDPDHTGYIKVESLEMLLLHGTNNTTRGDNQKLSRLLSLKLRAIDDDENRIRRWCRKIKYFLHDNWQRIWILLLWIGVMLGLFAYKFVQYRRKAAYEVMGHCVCMAKGAAETLKLNMAIILLSVCRNTVTWLRNKTKLGIAIPFDDNLNFHKVITVAIAIGVGIHAIYHLACDFPRLLHANSEKYELMEPFFGDQPSNYWYFVKSWEGVTGIIMIVLMAIAFTLASPWLRRGKVKLPKPFNSLIGFNAFWYSHHLFVFVYALLIVHGIKLYLTKEWYKKTTWMYLAVPITIYALERMARALRSSIEPVEILKVACPLDLLALYMSKPQGFRYKSGQYMFINCSKVSPFEWHPFSITSSPGDDYLSVHIKGIGDWTKSIRAKFLESCPPSTNGESGLVRALQGDSSPSSLPKVRIDGPYGAPSQEYKQYEVVLLVGLGIGATPMISILKDIVNNLKANEEEEGRTMEEGTQSKSPRPSPKRTDLSDFKTRKAYFYWMTPKQGYFDWFKEVMDEVVEADHRGVIELHNHCTSVYEEGDARSTLITMLQTLNHAKNGVDILSGTRVKSHFGKPNWHSVYDHIATEHPQARVGVFYCGPPNAAIELRQLASDFSRTEFTKFDFHKENF